LPKGYIYVPRLGKDDKNAPQKAVALLFEIRVQS
jgi:hypothetical protein